MRDTFPDVLRGFALLGIALVNIPLLAIDPVLHNEGGDLTVFSNAATAFIVVAFFQAKFYLLFSFLFTPALECMDRLAFFMMWGSFGFILSFL